MKKYSIIIILISLLLNQLYAEQLITRTKFIMGTYITIKLPQKNSDLFKPAFDIFKDLDNKLSIYKKDSEISNLNRKKQEYLSKIILKVIKESLEISEETKGFFDITVGKLTKNVYKFGTEHENIPENKVIFDNLQKISYKNVKIEGNKVILKKGAEIDLGGIGKGFSVDKVSEFLIKKGVKEGVISASGDIRCISICSMYIQNPFGYGWTVKFKTKYPNTSISTSGNYERFIKSKKFNHLINPKTGKPQESFASITLISIGNNTYIDAYATAVSVMPVDLALKFLEEKKKLTFILILNSGQIIFGKNISDFVILNGLKTKNQ